MKDPVRMTELWAYFTHCNLQPAHLLLALKSAMINAFKIKNFITAASFANRLLELPEVPEIGLCSNQSHVAWVVAEQWACSQNFLKPAYRVQHLGIVGEERRPEVEGAKGHSQK